MFSQSCGLLYNWFAQVVVEFLVRRVHQLEHATLACTYDFAIEKNEGEVLLAIMARTSCSESG